MFGKNSCSSSLLLVVILLFILGCGPSPATLIVGKWKVTEFRKPDAEKGMISFKTTEKDAPMVIEFKKDGTFSRTHEDGIENGTYEILDEGKTLRTIAKKDKKNTIQSITVEQLVIQNREDDSEVVFEKQK